MHVLGVVLYSSMNGFGVIPVDLQVRKSELANERDLAHVVAELVSSVLNRSGMFCMHVFGTREIGSWFRGVVLGKRFMENGHMNSPVDVAWFMCGFSVFDFVNEFWVALISLPTNVACLMAWQSRFLSWECNVLHRDFWMHGKCLNVFLLHFFYSFWVCR